MREGLEAAETEVHQCLDANPWALSHLELIETVRLAGRLRSCIDVIQARLVRECEGRNLPRTLGATGTTAWLAGTTSTSHTTAARIVRLGKALDTHQELGAATAQGGVNTEQAAVIADTLDALVEVELDPTDETLLCTRVPQDKIDKAEDFLIGQAAYGFTPHELNTLGERILSHVAPEIADRADAAALKRQQRAARAVRRLHLSPCAGGRVRIFGWLDTESAAHVTAALDPLSTPLPSADGPDPRSAGQRRADALVEVCQHAAAPSDSVAERPTVVVTVAFDTLKQQLGMGSFDLGGNLHPEAVRRLACDAHLIPAVLDTVGQPLDVGRAKRLVTGAMRDAVILRDKGCAFPGCARPARWTQAHHIVHWADGGPTSLANSVLLCGHHHRLIHKGQWHVRTADDGLPEFLPPPYLDPQQRPRRNTYHRRP